MANPLKILTVLTASQAAKFEQGLDVNSQKLTNVAAGTVSSDGVNYGQLTDVSGAIKSYVDSADTLLQGNLDALSGAAASALAAEIAARIAADSALSSSLLTYVDAENAAQDAAVSAMSGAFKSYIDAADSVLDSRITSVSGAIVSYVDAENAAQDAAVSAMSGAFKAYIDAENAAQDTIKDQLSSSLVSYIDAENAAQDAAMSAFSGAIKTYVDAADTLLQGNLDTVSGALKTYVDGQDLALSGAFDTRLTALSGAAASALATEIAARIAGDATVSGTLKTYVDGKDAAQTAARLALSSSLKSYVDSQDNALSSSMASYVDTQDAAEAAARAAEDLTFLKLDGTRAMTGNLDMGSNNIVSAGSGTFAGDVTVGGNLTVNGQLTYVNSVNLEVTDKLVTIAKGAANGAAADGAGIEVDGAGVSFVYDNAAGKWVSDIGLGVAGEAVFEGAMKLSGSAFSNITTPVVDGKFDVSDAIHALDVKVGSNADALSNAYDALRLVVTGTMSGGQVIVNLTTEGGAQFAVAQIANIALDVMVDADGTGYTNDLVAIKMYVDGASLKVQIDAPATPSAAFRLIAVNEKDGGLAV